MASPSFFTTAMNALSPQRATQTNIRSDGLSVTDRVSQTKDASGSTSIPHSNSETFSKAPVLIQGDAENASSTTASLSLAVPNTSTASTSKRAKQPKNKTKQAETTKKLPTTFHKFEKLPAEIRNTIYKLALQRNDAIRITSRRRRTKKFPARDHFGRLMRTNATISAEASNIYYSVNRFAVGDGWWGSRTDVNLQALKQFCRFVPKAFIARIKSLEVHFCSNGTLLFADSPMSVTIDKATEAKNIAKLVVKHFTGLEMINVKIRYGFGGWGNKNIPANSRYPTVSVSEWRLIGGCLSVYRGSTTLRKIVIGLTSMQKKWWKPFSKLSKTGKIEKLAQKEDVPFGYKKDYTFPLSESITVWI